MNYLLYAIFKITMMLCDEFIVRYRNSGVFSVGSNFYVRKFFSAFPDYGVGISLCCRLIVNYVGFPTMAPETSLDDALGVYGAFVVHNALGVHDALC